MKDDEADLDLLTVPGESSYLSNLHPKMRLHLARKQRRAMCRMAEALSIDHSKYPPTPEGTAALWSRVKESIGEGELTSPANRPPIFSDPFGVALECICEGSEEEKKSGDPKRSHGGLGWWRQTAIVKTEGRMVDQAEGERIVAFLKGQENVVTCDATRPNGERCGTTITTFSVHNGRISEMAMRDGYSMEWSEPE